MVSLLLLLLDIKLDVWCHYCSQHPAAICCTGLLSFYFHKREWAKITFDSVHPAPKGNQWQPSYVQRKPVMMYNMGAVTITINSGHELVISLTILVLNGVGKGNCLVPLKWM